MDNYRAGLSHQQQLRMFNQLDSHDTARFKTLLGRDVARLPGGGLAVHGTVYRAFITVMKWDWMVKTIRFAVNRSPAGGKAGYGVIRAVPANDCAA